MTINRSSTGPLETSSQAMSQQRLRATLLGAIDQLPPLTQWPAEWLKPKRAPEQTIRAWLEIIAEQSEALSKEVDTLKPEVAQSLVCDVLRQSALRSLYGGSDFPLLDQLTQEFLQHYADLGTRWSQDEQLLKRWLRDRATELTTSTPEESLTPDRDLETRVGMTRIGWDDVEDEEEELDREVDAPDLFGVDQLLPQASGDKETGSDISTKDVFPPRPSATLPDQTSRQDKAPSFGDVPSAERGSAISPPAGGPEPVSAQAPRRRLSAKPIPPPPSPASAAPPSPAPAAPPSPAPAISDEDQIPSLQPLAPDTKLIPPEVQEFGSTDERLSFPDAEPEFPDGEEAEFFDLTAAPPSEQIDYEDAEAPPITGAPSPLSPSEDSINRADQAFGEGDELHAPRPSADVPVERAEAKGGRAAGAIKAVKSRVWSQGAARRMIDHDLVRPGPLERLFERVTWLSWLFYKILGFSTLMVLHIVDNLWEFVSSYISRVFKGLMNLRSAARIAARRADGTLIEDLKRDMMMMMGDTEQLLCLPTTRDHITSDHHQLSDSVLVSVKRGTPLALALRTRARLDDLRRDLNFIRGGGAGQRLWRAILKWLIGLIPNPLELVKPWFNAFLLSFKISYSRTQVQENHQQLIDTVGRLIDELERAKSSGQHDMRASEMLVTELQGHLDGFLALCLQSSYQARPWRWTLLDRLSSLHTLSGHQADHPLSILEARYALLSACADVENVTTIGAQMKLEAGESYNKELKETKTLIKQLRKLRERGLV